MHIVNIQTGNLHVSEHVILEMLWYVYQCFQLLSCEELGSIRIVSLQSFTVSVSLVEKIAYRVVCIFAEFGSIHPHRQHSKPRLGR